MSRLLRGLLPVLPVVLLTGLPGTAPTPDTATVVSAALSRPMAPPARPAAVVALGDSSAAGEGGGSYVAGTRGEKGDWCHRSPNAWIQRTGLGGTAINLACSGARSADVAFGAPGHYTEGSQAQRLQQVAQTHRVTAVFVQLGANDDPSFAATMVSCVTAFLAPSTPSCSSRLAKEWPKRVAAMGPRVERALGDVRTAMTRAGYQRQDYDLVLLSYPSPVTETMTRTHGITGCPYRAEDAKWGRTVAVPELNTALRTVADRVGARFLDLSRASEGHEACSIGKAEWTRRLAVNPKAFVDGGVAAVGHLAQESFHQNAVGYTRLGGCLGAFVRGDNRQAACRIGSDGNLHAVAPIPAG
jgi:lysophospholipase L1-like esterase